jgi:hypothetical protein
MKTLKHKFVEYIPDYLEDDIIYISIKYKTVVHKCACGCGNQVITPITPTDWMLIFNGKTISLSPSIGNWNFECKSHYLIINNQIIYANSWTTKMINDNRKKDLKKKKNYFSFLKK